MHDRVTGTPTMPKRSSRSTPKPHDPKWTRKIPQLPRAHYCIDVSWDYVEWHLSKWHKAYVLSLSPDYQRLHVWTEAQQCAYIEYTLAGGEVGKTITWNCQSWGHAGAHPVELIDGKQRLEAVRKFMRGELVVYGQRYRENDQLDMFKAGMKWQVCKLSTRAEVLDLYLNINAGGTPHTSTELDRVRALRAAVIE